jgi:hypothetical protein
MRPRSDGVAQPLEAVGVHVILRAERPLIQDVLCALVDDRAFVPAERQPMLLVFEEILPHLRPNFLQHEPEVRRDRIIAQDCVPRLHEIDGAKHGEAGEHGNRHGQERKQSRPPEGKQRQRYSAGDCCRVQNKARRERQHQDVH